jgi:signal peptidase I
MPGDGLTPRQCVWLHQARHGYLTFTGRSMLPVVRPGDRIRVVPYNSSPKVGDLVVFHNGSGLILHRVVRVNEASRTLVTRGDRNLRDDRPIREEDVIGRFVALHEPGEGRCRPLPITQRTLDAWMRLLVRRGGRLVELSLRVIRFSNRGRRGHYRHDA